MAQRTRALVSFSASALLVLASCSQNQKVATEATANESVVSSVPPFQTKEPERYRATRTITTVTANGETTTTKNSLARDGELRRDESETAIYLNLAQGRFVLLPNEKMFADVTSETQGDTGGEAESETSPDRLLHVEPIATTYQKLATETVRGRSAQKYRVLVNNSIDAGVTVSETFIWIDEALQMPVRSETRSADGTRTTMELSDIALEVDGRLFQIPDDYEKIALRELRKRLKRSE